MSGRLDGVVRAIELSRHFAHHLPESGWAFGYNTAVILTGALGAEPGRGGRGDGVLLGQR